MRLPPLAHRNSRPIGKRSAVCFAASPKNSSELTRDPVAGPELDTG